MLGILAIVLFVLLILVGGDRGVVTFMTLIGNVLVLSIAIFLLASGVPTLLVTAPACMVITMISLFQQNGKNDKTKAAFFATCVVMVCLFVVIYLFVWKSAGGGLNEILSSQEDITYYNTNLHISMLGITVCMVLFSTLGAVIDTALSITSSVYEVSLHNPHMNRRELYESGMKIGRDIIGTTMNTLLFAYLGESILMFAYIHMGQYNMEMVINAKFIFQDVLILLFGGIACLFVVPIASYAIAFLRENLDKNIEIIYNESN